MGNVSNSEDIMDSRDIIARIADLETCEDAVTEAETDEERKTAEEEFDDDTQAELKALRFLAGEADSSNDWRYGETLIRDTYFEQYAKELADELDLIADDTKWPATCIDWDEAADQLKQDYMSVDFDGVEYWIRA